MAVRLRYQQDSLRREEELDGESEAILRATALALRGCLCFELIDLDGGFLKSDREIRSACASALRTI